MTVLARTERINVIYARHATDGFNLRLHTVLQRLAVDVQQVLDGNLVALVLGGGYGRGEGGVVQVCGVEQPYNDLDLVLVVKRKRRVSWEALTAVGKQYEAETGVHVDFSWPLTLRDIESWPCWMMWYDLVNGHVVLSGPPDVLSARASAALQGPLPLIEGTRLLLNRGAGLLWGMRVVQGVEPPPDSDFVRRNYQKCALALGDALLIAYRRFTTPYRGRDLLFDRLMDDSEEVAALQLGELYREALQFKFRPDEAPNVPMDGVLLHALAERWGSVFLHVERLRTGRGWPSLAAYARWRGLREPDQHMPGKWLRNLIRNSQLSVWSWRYPRERLYRQLPVLLGMTERAGWPADSARFLATWQRFS